MSLQHSQTTLLLTIILNLLSFVICVHLSTIIIQEQEEKVTRSETRNTKNPLFVNTYYCPLDSESLNKTGSILLYLCKEGRSTFQSRMVEDGLYGGAGTDHFKRHSRRMDHKGLVSRLTSRASVMLRRDPGRTSRTSTRSIPRRPVFR